MKYSRKILVYTVLVLLATGMTAALDINSSQALNYFNDGQIQFQVNTTGGIQSYGNLDLNNNQLQSFFGSACPSGEAMVDVNSDGTYQCTDISSEVSSDYVARSGDSMTGNLDMTGNSILDIGNLGGSGIVNSGNINGGAVGASELGGNAVTSSGGELDSSVAGNQLSLNSGSLGVVEGPSSGLNADQLDGVHLANIGWSDIAIAQTDISVSDLGAADSNLNMNGYNITNYYGSACPSGETVVDVNNDGTFQCMDVSNEVSGDYVTRTGDSMTGNLDMTENDILNIDRISSSVDGNDFWQLNDGSGGSNTNPYTMRFDTRDWRLWAGDTSQTVMELTQEGTVQIPNGNLSLGGSLTSGTVPTARLDNDAVTVNSGSYLTGGGTVSLGGSTTLNVDPSSITWGDTSMSQSDVSKGDVGLGNVRNVDLSNTAGSFLSYDTTNENYNVLAGNMNWGDLAIAQSDVSVSDLGAADSNLNMNGYNITNYYGSACPSGETVVDVNKDGSFDCVDVSNEVSGDYVTRTGDSMSGNLDMTGNNIISPGEVDGVNVSNPGNAIGVSGNQYYVPSGAIGTNELDETASYGLDWSNLAIQQSDVAASDVGLGSVRNVDLSNTAGSFLSYDTTNENYNVQSGSITWSDLGIARSDVSASDVGLGNVENIALSTAGWTDIGISQNDISVSNLGAADSNLNMNGYNITNYYGSACASGYAMVDVNNDGTFQCTDISNEVSGDYVSRSGDSMNGNLDMSGNNLQNVKNLDLSNTERSDHTTTNGLLIFDQAGDNNLNVYNSNLGRWVNLWDDSNDGSGSGLNADQLDGVQLANINWGDTSMSQSDVSASDVGLGSVRNVDLSNTAGSFLSYDTTNENYNVQSGSMTWTDLGISQSDVSKSDVSLGNVQNINQNSMGGGGLAWDSVNNDLDVGAGNAITVNADTIAVNEGGISHDNIGGVSSADHHSRYADSEAVTAIGSQNPLNTNDLDMDTGDQGIYIHDSTGNYNIKSGVSRGSDTITAGTGGSEIQMNENGRIELKIDESTAAGNTFSKQVGITLDGGQVSFTGPTSGISHDNLGGVSYNDHHGLGNDLNWDGSNNPRLDNNIDVNQVTSASQSIELKFDSSNSYIEVEDSGSTAREDIVVGRIYLSDNVGWFDGSGDDLQDNTVDSSEIQNGANFDFNANVDHSSGTMRLPTGTDSY